MSKSVSQTVEKYRSDAKFAEQLTQKELETQKKSSHYQVENLIGDKEREIKGLTIKNKE
jgi:hypothetical protein